MLPKQAFGLMAAQLNEVSILRDANIAMGDAYADNDLYNNGESDYFGPWYFWQQILGPVLPMSQYGVQHPDLTSHTLLLRTVTNPQQGFCWDVEHNTVLSFWIANDDLAQRKFDRAFAQFTDFL